MRINLMLSAAFSAVLLSNPTIAQSITIEDAYARSSGSMAISGAAFMIIHNSGDEDDRLINATSDVAARVELHTHLEEDGIMKMRQVEDGFVIPAEGEHHFARGGDHIMFMGLNEPFEQDNMISVTLTFEHAGDIEVEIPVDLDREESQMMHGMMGGSGG